MPTREAAPAPRRGDSFNSSPREGGSGGGAERDWGAARGAKFTPSTQVAAGSQFGGGGRESSQFSRESSQFGRESRENSQPGRQREEMPMGPSHADEASAWRSSKPLAEIKAQEPAPGRSSEQSSPGLADTESTVSHI